MTSTEHTARPELVAALLIPPDDCTKACVDGDCDCSGVFQVRAYSKESVEAALADREARIQELQERVAAEIQAASTAELRAQVLDGAACADEQIAGNGPCGVCVECLRARIQELERTVAGWRTIAGETSSQLVAAQQALQEWRHGSDWNGEGSGQMPDRVALLRVEAALAGVVVPPEEVSESEGDERSCAGKSSTRPGVVQHPLASDSLTSPVAQEPPE